MTKKTIACDFDGVIHLYSEGWKDGSIYDPPQSNARKFMGMLMDNGFDVVIYSTRLNPELNDSKKTRKEMEGWLERYWFEKGVHYTKICKYKPPAIAYIDDRAIRFTNWQDVVRYFI